MSIFSKLFSSPPTQTSSAIQSNFEYIQNLLKDEAEFYTNIPIFFQDKVKHIEYMMIHPQIGVVLFNCFNYSASELKGVTASKAESGDKSADIQTQDDKSFIQSRFEDIFLKQIAPVYSLLVCPTLSEHEFDTLDESFHELIPKHLALFSDSNNAKALHVLKENKTYDIKQIKHALFSEFNIAQNKALMNPSQQSVVHLNLSENLCVQGLPGSGKSSVLIAKALYEKQKNPKLDLIIFASRACNVHHLQSLIFSFIEQSNWMINPAEISVSSFDSIQRRHREKEKYELIICDNVNEADVLGLSSLLAKEGKLLVSSNHHLQDFTTLSLEESFRLKPCVSAACEGLRVENLNKHLSFLQGNIFMNTLLTLANLMKDVDPKEITIVHYDKEESLKLQTEINNYFEPVAYQFDDIDKKEGILIYPLTHIACILNTYVIVVINEDSTYDNIELISRANEKSFILSPNKDVYQIINQIKTRIDNHELF